MAAGRRAGCERRRPGGSGRSYKSLWWRRLCGRAVPIRQAQGRLRTVLLLLRKAGTQERGELRKLTGLAYRVAAAAGDRGYRWQGREGSTFPYRVRADRGGARRRSAGLQVGPRIVGRCASLLFRMRRGSKTLADMDVHKHLAR